MPIFLNGNEMNLFFIILAIVKYIAAVLLVCIIGMTLQPLLPHVSVAKSQITKVEKSCCKSKHHTENKDSKQKKDDCCSRGPCSFFGGSCGCCVGFTPYPPTFKFKSIAVINVMNAHVEQTTSYDISIQDFHPPESA